MAWTPPQSDLAITQSQVEYRRSGSTSWNNATALSGSPQATSTILIGLEAGTEYIIRVRAVSEIGVGEWSVAQTGITAESENLCTSSTAIWCMLYTCGRYIFHYSVYGTYVIILLFPLQFAIIYLYLSIYLSICLSTYLSIYNIISIIIIY